MIALLPITRFKIDYDVASGRPFSQFERLLLEAVGNGQSNIERLHSMFCVHRRVVIEGVVTLMQAGWIALERDNEFTVTEAGLSALSLPGVLPPTTFLDPRVDFVIVERMMGQVSRKGAVLFQDRRKLRSLWDVALKLPVADLPPTLDPSVAGPLLARDSNEWIHWIRATSPIRRGGDYVVLSVDEDRRSVIGLPREWEILLIDEILDHARRSPLTGRHLSLDQQKELAAVMQPFEATATAQQRQAHSSDDIELVVELGSDNLTHLRSVLNTTRSHIVLCFADIDVAVCAKAMPLLMDARTNGISVDLLYTGPRPHGVSLAAIDTIQKDVYSQGREALAKPSVTFAMVERLPLNAIICDGERGYTCYLHSQSILGPRWISPIVHILSPSSVGQLCHVIADAYSYDSIDPTAPLAVRLRTAAASGDARGTPIASFDVELPAGIVAKPSVYQGLALASKFRALISRAISVITVAIPDVPENCGPMLDILGSLMESRGIGIVVCCQLPDHNTDSFQVVEAFRKRGGEVRLLPGVGLSWALSNNELIVGSLNWLAPLRVGADQEVAVGIHVEGEALVNAARAMFGL